MVSARSAESSSVQVFLNGAGILVPDDRGEPILDDTFLVVFHAHHEDRVVTLPGPRWGASWTRVLDTERGFATDDREHHAAKAELAVLAHSLWVLRRET